MSDYTSDRYTTNPVPPREPHIRPQPVREPAATGATGLAVVGVVALVLIGALVWAFSDDRAELPAVPAAPAVAIDVDPAAPATEPADDLLQVTPAPALDAAPGMEEDLAPAPGLGTGADDGLPAPAVDETAPDSALPGTP